MPVTFIAEDQNVDPNSGQLVDVYVLTYTIPGKPGQFTTTVPKNADALAAAETAIAALDAQIVGMYAIP
jgi:hypothetical protein